MVNSVGKLEKAQGFPFPRDSGAAIKGHLGPTQGANTGELSKPFRLQVEIETEKRRGLGKSWSELHY